MKRIALLSVMALAVTVGVFAQTYVVQEVKGRVQKESGNNRVDVKVGDTITADTVIITGVGASLVLKDGDKTYTVSAARNGTVVELATNSSNVRIGGTVIRTDTGAVSRTTGQTSTASARASDAAGEDDIAAE